MKKKKKTCLAPAQVSDLQLEWVGSFLAPPGRSPQVSGSSHTPSTLQEMALHIPALCKEPPQGTTLPHFTVAQIFHPRALP